MGAGAALLVVFAVLQKEKHPRKIEDDAGPAPSDTPSAEVSVKRPVVDAGPQDAGPPEPPEVIDGGASACKLLFGPVEQPFVGPAALSVDDKSVDVISHQNGIMHITSFPLDSTGAKRRDLPGQPTKASRPACAAAGEYVFCSDANGNVHRALHAQASDKIFVHADAGARISAAKLPGGHVALAYLAVFQTSEGSVSQALVRVDEQDPVRVSDEGAGATDVVIAERGNEAVVLYVDARMAMSPLHARSVSFEGGKTKVGQDNVVYVGGGSDHQVLVALGTDAAGGMIGLMPTTADDAFGLATVKIETPPHIDEPSEMSPYPNGINTAPIAATNGGKKVYVARVRPLTADATSPHVIELGHVAAGKLDFTADGVVSSAGSVKDVTIATDKSGAVWLHYTDQEGSWLEKRACP